MIVAARETPPGSVARHQWIPATADANAALVNRSHGVGEHKAR